ncbi:PREDICTED: remodeling and spacing factor 1 isoform X1 [Papilio xuthus]|uniref:Remodeling and spacing factor 1 isoform X1 n=1 Tax=Papilio xuthus TaxID=66420 RepID=A0AAJ6ZRE8_PAPXU|nr:PREDICTED: remodeling and spacing factor 1 isoform X1 [Papilio xuthus]
MASDGEISCTTDPNFAVIYSFLKVFGKLYGLEIPTIAKLQELIENTQEVLDPLKELHVRLLRRALKSIQVNRWERALIKFCHQQRYHQEAWEIERFSYKKASTQVKLRILKLLLEYQFTCHPKFKNAVNALSSKELRLDPIGRDKYGCVYWLQIDHEANLCMYKEDQDEETWQLIASNREEFVKIISQLKSGEQVCQPVVNEDSSSVDVPAQVEVNKSEVEENEEEFLSPESESGNESDEPKVEKCKDDITSKEEEPETTKDDAPKDDAPKDIVKETIEENNLITNNVDKVEDKKDDMTITNEPDSKKEEEQTESNISEKDTDKEETKEQEVGEEVSEEIEEPVMIIKGEGNGEDCESSYFIGEEISEPVMFIYGDGWGCENDTGNPEAIEQEDNTELEENSDVDNPSEEVLNGEHANNVPKSNSRVKLNKSAKLKYSLSSVTKRSLRKQSNDNTDGSKSDSKKHCVRNLDKSNGSNSIATSSQRELRSDSSVHEKSTDCESSGKNKMKKIITKVKKREGMRTLRNNKEIVNSISEPESPRNSKSSIIEKRKSSVSSDHDGNASENAESGNVEGEETKVEDTLPPKKIRLESTPESDDVSHSKSETIDNIKDENIENNDGNTENDKESIINRKKIKANKGKLKGKKFLQNKIEISEISKDYDKVDVSDNKASKAIKRSLLNKSMNDKTRSESQSDSEDEEPIKSGKRLKFKPKKIVTKSRKKIEAKILEKCSSESEDETLYSLGKKSAKKVLKKKPKAKEKEKTTAASTNVTDNDTPVRQSRRIAQMKIKEEADRRHLEEVTLRELKMIHKKKNKEEEEEWQASGSSSEGEARARRSAAWRSDSTGPEPDSDSDEPLFEHHEEPELEAPRSDHEFSPESDLESGEPTAPLKLARTLQEGKDEGFCKRCGSGEQPEWILLCDRCDAGYHASCLAPVLLLVPEGDWFCPPCNHEKLISALEEELVKYDQLVVAVAEERERRRAEHPHSDSEQEPDKPELDHKSDDKSDGSGSGSDWSSSSSSGAVYRLRARRQLPVSYRAQEYDRLISSAIKEEYVEPTTSAGNQGRGKDISTIIEAAEEEKMKAEREARDQGEVGEVGEGSQKKQKKKRRRKPRKLNSLDVPSEDDDETDEDFKDTGNVSSMESSSEDMSSSAERDSRSSDSLPIIRPGRPDKKERTKLEDSSPEVKKKKKGLFEDSSSESADTKELPKKAKSRKRGDGRRSKLTQYDAAGNVVRARVTYGGLSDGPGPNDWSPKHRTRQRKINYTEMPNTESEDEMHKSSGKHMTDSSDEFRVTDEWDNSSSGSERAKRRRGEGGEEGEVGEDRAGEEQRRRALCDLVTKTAVVPLEKLPEHVTREKTEQLHQHLLEAQQADLAARPMRGRGGRGGGRGSRGPRGGRGRGGGGGGGVNKSSPSSDDALAKLVGVKIKDLRETGEMPMRPNQAERDRKRQEREAKQAEKEARRMERLQKKEEKEKLKEQRAKEREEKKLARIALQESRRVKREKVEYMAPVPVGPGPGGMRLPTPGSGPPPPHGPHDYRERFPATPRLQVRAELRGIAMGDDRMQLMHRPEQAPPREGTLSVAGSPQPFKPAPEEPSLITRMPHMLNHQYRGPMMYSGGAGGSSGYGPRAQNMMYQLHPGMNRAQYPQGYYQHLRAMPPAYPGHPPSPSGMHGPAPQHRQGPPPHGPHGPPGSSPHHGPHGPPVSSPLQYGSGPPGPHGHPGSSAMPPGAPGNLHGSPASSHGAPGAHNQGPNQGLIPPNMQGPRPHMPHAGSHPMGPGHMGPRGLHGPHNSSINPHGAVPGPPGLGANGSLGPNPHGPLGSRLHGPPGMHGPSGHGPPGANPLGPRGPEDSSPHRPGPSPLSAMAHSLPPGLGPQGPEAHGPIGPTALPVHRPPFAPGPPGISAAGLPPNSIPDQAAVATRPGSAPRPASTASPGQSPHPPNLTPGASSSPPVSAEPPIQIKAEVKTEPEYRTPPGSPSQHPPSPEPLRNHPKIKHTDNKDRRPRYPLGPYAPQYGPYGPYAPPAAQAPDAAMNLQARPQHPSPLQRIHANMAQYLPALADKPEPFLQHMRLPRPPYGAPPPHASHAPPGPRYADLQRPAAPTPPPQLPQPSPAPMSPEIRKDESPKVTEEEEEREEEGGDSQPSSPPDTKPDFSSIDTANKIEPLKAPEHIKVEAEPEAAAGPGPGARPGAREEGGEFGGLVSYFSSQHEDELDA